MAGPECKYVTIQEITATNSCVRNESLVDIQGEDKIQYVTLGMGSSKLELNDHSVGNPIVSERDSDSHGDSCTDEEPKQKSRKRNPENWKQNVRKRNKNKGLEYVKSNGKICEKKKLGPPCTCREKCYMKIGKDACEKIFQNFWKLGDHSLQNAYIAGCVRIFLPKHCYKKDGIPSRRFFSRNFHVTVNGVDTEVCKQAFLNMHAISNGRLDRLLKKKQEIGNTGFDERGRHSNKVNKIPAEKIRLVRKHIDSVREKAGFTGKRKPKKVEILSGSLNIRTMYRSYKEEMIAKGLEPVCEYRYRKIFHTDFHLDFGRVPSGGNAALSTPLNPDKKQQTSVPNEEETTKATQEMGSDQEQESLTTVNLGDVNLNVPMADGLKTTKATSPFGQLEKEFQIRAPENTSYVLSQEVFRLDYSTNYTSSQQNWIFTNPS